jgi:predicted xylose isomerase-like sugar epimerase
LFVEEKLEKDLYQLVLDTRHHLLSGETQLIRHDLNQLISKLGFSDQTHSSHQTVLECVQQITERPMHGFEYLQVK